MLPKGNSTSKVEEIPDGVIRFVFKDKDGNLFAPNQQTWSPHDSYTTKEDDGTYRGVFQYYYKGKWLDCDANTTRNLGV